MGALLKKIVKAPRDIESIGLLKIKGLTVIGSSTDSDVKVGNMYLQDHAILFVQEGVYKVRFGN